MPMLFPLSPTGCGGIGVTTTVPDGVGAGRLTMHGAAIIPVIGVVTIPATGGLTGDIITVTIPAGAEDTGLVITLIPTVAPMGRYAQVEVRGLPEVPISVVRTLIPRVHKEHPSLLLPVMTAA